AASTPRGYDSAGLYSAGAVARYGSRAIAADYHLREVSSWPIALLGVHCLVYALPGNADPDQLLSIIARDPRVESAQPLLSFGTVSSRYNDPYSTLQRNIEQMSVAEAHELTRGASVRVAVIDTGVAVAHRDQGGMQFVYPCASALGGDRSTCRHHQSQPGRTERSAAHAARRPRRRCRHHRRRRGADGWASKHVSHEYRHGDCGRFDRKRACQPECLTGTGA